jgi:hypothetical protein
MHTSAATARQDQFEIINTPSPDICYRFVGPSATQDFDFAYALHADGVCVATFAEGRMGYREWARRNGRLTDIYSIDYRYDHDVDELMG